MNRWLIVIIYILFTHYLVPMECQHTKKLQLIADFAQNLACWQRHLDQALLSSIKKNDAQKVIHLITIGACVHTMMEMPLYCAAKYASIDIIRIVINAGAQADIIPGTINPLKRPLHACIECHDNFAMQDIENEELLQGLEKARYLIEKGADVLLDDGHYKFSFFERLCSWAAVEKELIECGLKNGKNETVKKNLKKIKQLVCLSIESVAKKDDWQRAVFYHKEKNECWNMKTCTKKFRDSQGNSLLHNAVEMRNNVCARLLLKQGAEVNEQNNEGRTPLHNAMQKRDIVMSSLLLGYGADLCKKNNKGITAFEYALNNERLWKMVRRAAGVNGI